MISLCLIILILAESTLCNVSPNFVIILADDVGYGDLHSYGHPTQEKGAIDQLVDEGMKFTQWYSAASVCSPSRAALLTGRLPIRLGVAGPLRVFREHSSGGLPKSETTIAEALEGLGYKTGFVGKWHLGINEKRRNDGRHLPRHHGFDFVGHTLPMSILSICDPFKFSREQMAKRCTLYRGDEIVEQPIDLQSLTERFRNDSVSFIRRNKNNPFFLYLNAAQTHAKLFCNPRFCNSSKRGLYGDSMNELSWLVGEVVAELQAAELQTNTLLFFLSDHGPQVELCVEGGSTGAFRGGKASTWEGGFRVPCIAWWPGTILPGSSSNDPLTTMDIFPTLLELAGGHASTALDGVSIAPLLRGHNLTARPHHDIMYFYCSDRLTAVRSGAYKVHFFSKPGDPDVHTCDQGVPHVDHHFYFDCNSFLPHDPPLIFNVDQDPGEKHPLNPKDHFVLLQELSRKTKEHKSGVTRVPNQLVEVNPSLRPCCAPPRCMCPDVGGKEEL